jgi:flagellar motor switch protein FliM
MVSEGVIRRKVTAARGEMAEGGPGADRGWRLALARAARDQLKAPLEVTMLAQARVGLAEVLEVPPDRALVAVLEGPDEGLGMLALSPEVLQAMVEVLTIGRVAPMAAAARKPTRTDAAMLAPMIDAALIDLEAGLAEEADLTWAGGWRYASFLEDPRPLGLMLEDIAYRLVTVEVDLSLGARRGRVVLALPAEGRGCKPRSKAAGAISDTVAAERRFAEELAEQVSSAEVRLEAVLTRVSLPLSQVVGLSVGNQLVLNAAALDKISLEGLDGRKMAEGRLGQNRGLRAVRLTVGVNAGRGSAPMADPAVLTPSGALADSSSGATDSTDQATPVRQSA